MEWMDDGSLMWKHIILYYITLYYYIIWYNIYNYIIYYIIWLYYIIWHNATKGLGRSCTFQDLLPAWSLSLMEEFPSLSVPPPLSIPFRLKEGHMTACSRRDQTTAGTGVLCQRGCFLCCGVSWASWEIWIQRCTPTASSIMKESFMTCRCWTQTRSRPAG